MLLLTGFLITMFFVPQYIARLQLGRSYFMQPRMLKVRLQGIVCSIFFVSFAVVVHTGLYLNVAPIICSIFLHFKVTSTLSQLCCTCVHWDVFEFGIKYMQLFFGHFKVTSLNYQDVWEPELIKKYLPCRGKLSYVSISLYGIDFFYFCI